MLVHSVYFWLKPELTPEQLDDFDAGLRSLTAIETVKGLHYGNPAPSDRPVVECSYTRGLVVNFNDRQELDTYAVHPVHLAFVEQFKQFWTEIRVFDVE